MGLRSNAIMRLPVFHQCHKLGYIVRKRLEGPCLPCLTTRSCSVTPDYHKRTGPCVIFSLICLSSGLDSGSKRSPSQLLLGPSRVKDTHPIFCLLNDLRLLLVTPSSYHKIGLMKDRKESREQ